MATKLDKAWALNIIDGVQAIVRELERLEGYCAGLESKLESKLEPKVIGEVIFNEDGTQTLSGCVKSVEEL